SCGGALWIALPSSQTSPPSAVRLPATVLKSVLLPAPFGPMSPVMLPAAIVKLTLSTARTPPNAFTRSFTSRSAADTSTLSADLREQRSYLLDRPHRQRGDLTIFDAPDQHRPDDVAGLIELQRSGRAHVANGRVLTNKIETAPQPVRAWTNDGAIR